MRNDKGGPLEPFNDVGHGEGLARTRYAQKSLVLVVFFERADQGIDRLGLIALRLVIGDKLEFHQLGQAVKLRT